ncbi:hypothetical protein ABZX51_007262 [Aspergillus tubingensis]
MPSHSGLFTSFTGRVLAIDDENLLSLHSNDHQPSPGDKLRANGEFWLYRDDGLIGKFGNPDKVCNPLLVTSSTHDLIQRFQVAFVYDNCVYNIWVETRGYSDDALEVSWPAAELVAIGSYVTDVWPPDYHSTGLSPSYLAEITVIISWLLTTRLVS